MRIGTTRPYPETRLTSELWCDVPLQFVEYTDLITTQDGIYLHALLADDVRTSDDPFPHAVSHNGSVYLEDGHTRVARDFLRGYHGAWMRVFVTDNGR